MNYQILCQLLVQKWTKHQTKIRFLLVGGLNTVIGLVTFPALYFLLTKHGIKYLEILVISQVFCVTLAFFTNKHIVFRTKGNNIKEYLKFLSFHFSYFLLNLAALPLLVEVIGIHPVIAQSTFAILVIISSYFWYSKVTFISKKFKL